MPNVSVFDVAGKKVSDLELDAAVFGIEYSASTQIGKLSHLSL